MGLHIVVGAQFGSEGKGKVAYYVGKKYRVKAAAKVGGPNSGHTVFKDGKVYPLLVFPTMAVEPDVHLFIPAGAYFKLSDFYKEKELLQINSNRIHIDPNAVLVDDNLKYLDSFSGLRQSIGSTGSGTGEAVRRRIVRNEELMFAKDVPELFLYLSNTVRDMRKILDSGGEIVVEGTQGYGLSVLHSPYYPFVTSRDTTAASVVSELGLSPFDVKTVYLVARAFPIRVGGNSGILPKETTWADIAHEAGYRTSEIEEYTTVTNKLRRVAYFDQEIPKDAINANKPSHLAINHLDLFDSEVRKQGRITEKAYKALLHIEKVLGMRASLLGFNSKTMVEREEALVEFE